MPTPTIFEGINPRGTQTLIPCKDVSAFPRSEQAVLGAKNFIPKSKKTTASANGIDFTFNADGSVTFSGTSTATAEVAFDLTTDDMLKVGDLPSGLILNGSDSTDEKYCIESIYRTSANAYISDQRSWNGDLKLTIPSNAYYIRIAVLVKLNVTISTPVTVYPMLRIATDPDPTYAPPAMTNMELTENKVANSVIASVENGNTSSQAYNIGDYFIRNNLICKANKAISAGETLVAGSTHSTGTLGLFMNKYLILDGSYVQTLSNGSDLNDLSIGEARVSNTDAPSILNRPSEVTTSFFIITIQIWGSEYLRQILFARDTANIYTRVKASTWGNWYKIGLTQV